MVRATKRKYAPRLPPQQRKEQLLDTALEIIALQGYPAVSIDAIARRAGVSRPVVYGMWPDLDALLTNLHLRQEQRAMSQVAEAIPPGPGEHDPDELLVASFRSFLEAVARDPLTWRLFLLPIEGMPAAVARRAAQTRAALRGQVTQLVAWGVDQRGGPAGLDNELMAHFLLSTGEDAGRLVLSDPERFPPSLLSDNLAAVLGALKRKPRRR